MHIVLLTAALLGGCSPGNAVTNSDAFPIAPHSLLPTVMYGDDTQIAAGAVTGKAPVQPIAFPHNRHVQLDGLDCQYCHSAARNSIHAGVPEMATCMGCHSYVLKESPEIKLLTQYWERGEPVPWKKVNDVPDFVYFSHMRHVRAGVDCLECHGQVPAMTGIRDNVPPPAPRADTDPKTWEEAAQMYGPAKGTMTREATLQMGWCLDCHAFHPSVDTNYGDKAELRRAELKDCWTCHK